MIDVICVSDELDIYEAFKKKTKKTKNIWRISVNALVCLKISESLNFHGLMIVIDLNAWIRCNKIASYLFRKQFAMDSVFFDFHRQTMFPSIVVPWHAIIVNNLDFDLQQVCDAEKRKVHQ